MARKGRSRAVGNLGHGGLSLAQQLLCLRQQYPGGIGRVRRSQLTWRCPVRPTAVSRLYEIELRYRIAGAPQVFVVSPDLSNLADGKELPHVYSQTEQRLCLYLPGSGEWRPVYAIAATSVPWAYEWLFFFEEWLGSGEWRGGGRHPPPDSSGGQRRRRWRRRRVR